MDKQSNDLLEQFLYAINVDQNYIKGHDIGREMLLSGENKQLAKLLASIAGLVQQFENNKITGYTKFRKMVSDRIEAMPNQPFDEQHLMSEINKLDEFLDGKRNEHEQKQPFQLKLREIS